MPDLRGLARGPADRHGDLTAASPKSFLHGSINRIGRWAARESAIIEHKENRQTRRERQARELESNQQALRDSIAESKRLADEADAMIRHHRHEGSGPDGGK
ncbi:MAG: hypothetical protein QOK17_1371 [Sphingomonadales bacterium]|nr:hypothetical protein [Sphingomonadales bacterium]